MSEALISAFVALIDARIAAANAATNALTPTTHTPVATPAAADPFAGLGSGMTVGTAAPAIEVTPKMIQELIIPLLSNDVAKARLSAAMQELGIAELPAARPDQLPALYAKFKAIADEVNGAAATKPAGGVNLI